MHRFIRAAVATVAISLLALAGGATAANAAPAIPVNNGQETTGAEGGAHGKFSYTIEGSRFCYTVTVTGLTTAAAAAHIHKSPQGVAGGIVIHLVVPNETAFTTSGCTMVADAMLLADIGENPRDYYVNVHTPTYPGGEVRGQLK